MMRQKLLIAIFLFLIFGLGIGSLCKKDQEYSESENRYLQQLPELTAKSLFFGDFTADYETYVTDQFIGRNQWIGAKTYCDRAMLQTESGGVFFCKDGYLMEDHQEDEFTSSLAKLNLKVLHDFVENHQEMSKQNRLKVLLVPTASQVLSEKLPFLAAPYDQSILLKQEEEDLQSAYVDVLSALEAKKEESIYYRTDHHWTTRGAYYAYCQWAKSTGIQPLGEKQFQIKTVTDQFLGTLNAKVNIYQKPDTIQIYEPLEEVSCLVNVNGESKNFDTIYDWSKLKTKDKYGVFFGGNDGLIKVETDTKNSRSILVIKDSFANSFVPFLTSHYQKIVMVDLRYYNENLENLIQDEGITDICILYNVSNLVTDRNIQKLK